MLECHFNFVANKAKKSIHLEYKALISMQGGQQGLAFVFLAF